MAWKSIGLLATGIVERLERGRGCDTPVDEGKSTEDPGNGGVICRRCLKHGIESAKVDLLPLDLDLSPPLTAGLVPRDALCTGDVVGLNASVDPILGATGLPKVDPPVVHSISVDVIDLINGMAPSHDRESNPVRQQSCIVEPNPDISPVVLVSDHLPAIPASNVTSSGVVREPCNEF